MNRKVIIEGQYREEAEKLDEICEFETPHRDHFLIVAEAIIDGGNLEGIAEALLREGWKEGEAVSFVNSVQADMKLVIDELGAGKARVDIVDMLIEDDWLPATAANVVGRLDSLIMKTRKSMERENKTEQNGTKWRATAEIGFSALFLIMGLAASLLALNTTEGRTHIVAYGAMLFGLVGLVAGLVHLTSAHQR